MLLFLVNIASGIKVLAFEVSSSSRETNVGNKSIVPVTLSLHAILGVIEYSESDRTTNVSPPDIRITWRSDIICDIVDIKYHKARYLSFIFNF